MTQRSLVRQPGSQTSPRTARDADAQARVDRLGELFQSSNDTQEFLEQATHFLSSTFALEFLDMRVRGTRVPGAHSVRALFYQDVVVGWIAATPFHDDLESLCPWLGLALGLLARLDEANAVAWSQRRVRIEAMETLQRVVALHEAQVQGLAGPPGLVDCASSAGSATNESNQASGERPGSDAKVERFARRWSLSRRQQATLGALVRGLANKEIAAALGVAVVTVEGHLSHVYRSTGIRTRRELVAAILREA